MQGDHKDRDVGSGIRRQGLLRARRRTAQERRLGVRGEEGDGIP